MVEGRFAGKVALITGGGSGIGAASARRIADEGGKVVVMGRREAPLRAVAEVCGGHAVIGDTASLDDLARAVAEAEERFGGLDVLVANAGIELFGSVETVSLGDWRRVFEVNLEGAMLAARASIPAMRRRDGGAILLLASVAALAGAPSYVSYLTTKAGMLGLNRSIAHDYGPENIRCNALCPGWVRTEMAERAIADIAALKGISADALARDMVKVYPLRRMAEPAEIAAIVAFLCSSDAAFVTGATLSADGGGGIVDVGTLQFG
ncbi:SDR family NAD(P)-dependent oxidoreductase [Novosphingobium taihuense]|uniref:NAD(P)-dependent dehydrogenase (Short-subunit alcohol dehydrogenase family) n=1 Tax=Novosphingobium taihuense TaxID=260085 RepID=A0A7W7EUG0_9SPHN|nr:glucose 1-dehydrogenase [Novosphingobium taihuense]MBB4614388.1 NAD(P)-dependent dehydrogenase (short-subunit alcohol dehydrogenase family) [Novosphingobium taihuense]TWH86369.1 NAD(P)-dependent dehydrogenase (short-subunit alcohol dehydrogenase family) [Novosphingobium taihuense]